jgi:hypothetical protein
VTFDRFSCWLGAKTVGKGCQERRFDRGTSRYLQGLVLAVEVEDLPPVTETIRFLVQESRWHCLDFEVEESLASIVVRLQAEQHRAPLCLKCIAVAGNVLDLISDGVDHGISVPGSPR